MADDESHAIDEHGRPIPMSPARVKAYVGEVLADPASRVIAIILERKGEVAVSVFGPPSQELVDILTAALRGLQRPLN